MWVRVANVRDVGQERQDETRSDGFVQAVDSRIYVPAKLGQELIRRKERRERRARAKNTLVIQGGRILEAPWGKGTESQSPAALPKEWAEQFANTSPRHHLVRIEDFQEFFRSHDRSADRDVRDRNKKLLASMGPKGQYRPLATLAQDWRSRLDVIEAEFPNFREVISFLRASFAIAEGGDRSIRFIPMVLDGPPGVGKSLFAEALARFCGVPMRRHNFEAAQEGGSLTGTSDFWSNSKTGAIFDLLTDSDIGNPLVFGDELDKSMGDERFDPVGPLYALLEPMTARNFRDLSVPNLRLDASRILWVFTSNDYHRVPVPIRSRLRKFSIPTPTREEAQSIARRIHSQLRTELQLSGFEELPGEVAELLCVVPPRAMRTALFEAFGCAITAGRNQLAAIDLPEGCMPNTRAASRREPLLGISLRGRLTLFFDVVGVLIPDKEDALADIHQRLSHGAIPELPFAPALAEVLAGRQEVDLVLMTRMKDEALLPALCRLLGSALARHVVGTTANLPVPRPLQVAAYIAGRGVTRWLAIDDERVHWPADMRDRVIVTDHRRGLGDPEPLARLSGLLAVHGDH